MHVSADPSAQLLVPGGFGIRVGTRAQHHHEQRGCPDFASNRIVHRNRCAGPIHEALLARLVHLAKNYILLPAPTLVDRKSTRLNSSHITISYAVFCLKKKNKKNKPIHFSKP